VANVKVPFKMQPRIASFGRIERNAEPKRKTITITRGDGGPLALELAPNNYPNVKTSLREIEPGEKYELDVELVPPWPNTSLRANLKIKTGIPEAPEETIRVYAQIAPRLRAVPSRFRIPQKVASDLQLKTRLLWSGGDPGKVLEASASDPKISVHVEERNEQQLVVLDIPAGYECPSGVRPTVTVKTDDAEVPTLRIPVDSSRARGMRPARNVKRMTLTPKKTTQEASEEASAKPTGKPDPQKPKPKDATP
jgi:hypothetical protein